MSRSRYTIGSRVVEGSYLWIGRESRRRMIDREHEMDMMCDGELEFYDHVGDNGRLVYWTLEADRRIRGRRLDTRGSKKLRRLRQWLREDHAPMEVIADPSLLGSVRNRITEFMVIKTSQYGGPPRTRGRRRFKSGWSTVDFTLRFTMIIGGEITLT